MTDSEKVTTLSKEAATVDLGAIFGFLKTLFDLEVENREIEQRQKQKKHTQSHSERTVIQQKHPHAGQDALSPSSPADKQKQKQQHQAQAKKILQESPPSGSDGKDPPKKQKYKAKRFSL